jgi:hypothetical protein
VHEGRDEEGAQEEGVEEERLAAVPDPPRVVLISSRDAAAYGPRLDAAPACGFLAKRELSGASLAALVG